MAFDESSVRDPDPGRVRRVVRPDASDRKAASAASVLAVKKDQASRVAKALQAASKKTGIFRP